MASRKDYAKNKRGKAAASRSRPAPKRAPAKPARRFPSALLAVTLLLFSGLGYGLYQLTKVAPEKATTPLANSNPERPKPAPRPTPEPAPAQPQTTESKRFEFYEMLEKSEVKTPQVEAYKSTPKTVQSQTKYLLQAGSFRSKSDAERMRAQLILMGLPNVHTNSSTSSDGSIWYRVRTGPFENRSRLSKAYDKLVQKNIQPLRIKQ
ncbi:SPOR domain-containing protein [Neptuniibacter halophilus]|uniref:SPOR domain-containing protein n=1 Tax=Neptuniibacter halophilus TaxID=651666 RepID=UPI002573B942|nr:SPOR domain-containing protein [Neptuniibacter halophilus]